MEKLEQLLEYIETEWLRWDEKVTFCKEVYGEEDPETINARAVRRTLEKIQAKAEIIKEED